MSLTEFQGASSLFIVTFAILVHHYGFGVERLQASGVTETLLYQLMGIA